MQYRSSEAAHAAIATHNERTVLPGGHQPMVVRFAHGRGTMGRR